MSLQSSGSSGRKMQDSLNELLKRWWVPLSVAVAVAVVSVGVFGYLSYQHEKKLSDGIALLEELEKKIQEDLFPMINEAQDESEDAEPSEESGDGEDAQPPEEGDGDGEDAPAKLEEEIRIGLQKLIDEHENTYPAFKATFWLGEIEFEKSSWASAFEHYLKVAENAESGYLSALAIAYAAVALEEDGDLEGSIAQHRRLVDMQSSGAGSPGRALFNIGRIYEGLGKIEEAVESYNELLDLDETSPWGSLAQSRLIVLGSGE